MAIKSNGTTGTIGGSASEQSNSRWSIHFFYQNANAPANSGPSVPVALSDSTSHYTWGFSWNHTTVADEQAWFRFNGATADYAKYGSGLTSNTLYGLGCSYDGTTLQAYLNGTANTGTASADATPATGQFITLFSFADGAQYYDAGQMGEFAYWNVALTAAEFKALGLGISPLLVRPASLVRYLPLMRDIVPFFGGAVATAGGLTAQPHPPMYYPTNPMIYGPISSAVYQPLSASFSSAVSVVSSDLFTPNGIVVSPMTIAGTFAFPPSFTVPVTIANTFLTNGQGIVVSNLNISSQFIGSSGFLATGRYRW